MIQHINNRRFVNRPTLGDYTNIDFDTYLELAGGKEDVFHVRCRVHYFEKGAGKPMILLHGAGQSLYTFRNNIGDLSTAHRVIVPDLLGHGFSDCPEILYSVDEMSLALGAFMDALGVESATIMAFGQSCAYAAEFAAFNKDRVDRLVFINPGGFANTEFPGAKSIAAGFGSSINKYIKFPYMEKALKRTYFDRTLLNDEIVEEYRLGFENPEVRQAIRLCVANYDDKATIQKLMVTDKPVLLISSRDDTVTNPDAVAEYRSVLRNGFGVEIRNCGYFIHEEKPDKVNEAVLEFIARH